MVHQPSVRQLTIGSVYVGIGGDDVTLTEGIKGVIGVTVFNDGGVILSFWIRPGIRF
jgi:hypothetical protein